MSEPARPARIRRNPRDRASMRARPAQSRADHRKPVRPLGEVDGFTIVPVECEAGRPTAASEAALTAGLAVAQLCRCGVLAAPVDPDGSTIVADEGLRAALAQWGVDRVARLPGQKRWDGLTLGALLAGHLAQADGDRLVSPDTPLLGEAVRRAAAARGIRMLPRVVGIEADTAVCLEDAGTRERLRPIGRILLVEPDAFSRAQPDFAGEAKPFDLGEFAPPSPPFEDLGTTAADGARLPLAEASFIVGAGNGVSDWPTFHALAAALGAAEAGSRVVCDAGHLPRDRQVGSSGEIVAPRCYLAFGISGASQHLDGIAECRQVIAVDCDPHAPMLDRADLAVVGDAQAIMRALLGRLTGA
jgi:electron transfer flavoprotein alpha subunit